MPGAVDFSTAWRRFAGDRRDVSAELLLLLERLYDQISVRPPRLEELRNALRAVLSFLASPAGRTDENCQEVNFFLCLSEDVDWTHLPCDYGDILADMAGALHDTVSSPDIARMFESTPEQLLERLALLSDRPRDGGRS